MDWGVTPGKVGKRGAAAGSARGGGEGLAAADGAHEAPCDGGCSENEHQNIIMIVIETSIMYGDHLTRYADII